MSKCVIGTQRDAMQMSCVTTPIFPPPEQIRLPRVSVVACAPDTSLGVGDSRSSLPASQPWTLPSDVMIPVPNLRWVEYRGQARVIPSAVLRGEEVRH
ncbi:hypothetical protein J6590_075785 [Homalodisca vitripennis]|nr:hypothetical protein J6590_075785 [Homalodisca vitripennis]